MEAVDLARWTRFAAKGGIGKCTAICDCVAENADDLMFLKEDEITVLMQLEDPSGVYLGFCEGVIGRFSGRNVRFHSKLKKPVMAKRSSVNASTSTQNHGKSPTPSYGIKSPSPMAKADSPAPQNLSFSRRSLSLDEQVVISSISSELPPNTGSGLRQPDRSVAHSSKVGFTSLEAAGSDLEKGLEEYLGRAEESMTTSTLSTNVKTSTTSPTITPLAALVANEPQPPPSVALSEISHATTPPPQHNTAPSSHLPAVYASADPGHPTPSIVTQIPASLVLLSNEESVAEVTQVPDTSTSTDFEDSRISLALSDGEVGIGLSLLQDLADRGSDDDWSNSDSDEQDNEQSPAISRRLSSQQAAENHLSKRQSSQVHDRQSTVSEGSLYSDETASDGLRYEDTETGHGSGNDELEASITRTQRAYRDIDSLNQPGQGRHTPPPLQEQLTFPTVSPLSTSRFRFASSSPSPQKSIEAASLEVDYTLNFPPPPTHTPHLHRAGGSIISLSSTSSVNPVIVGNENRNTNSNWDAADRSRRPSLAHSTASASSDWEGSAADIYDDYRYSRYSAGSSTRTRTSLSSSKRASVSSKAIGAGDWTDTPPFPETLPKVDLGVPKTISESNDDARGSAAPAKDYPLVTQTEAPQLNSHSQVAPAQPQGSVRTRSRSNTTASLNPAPNLGTMPPAQIPLSLVPAAGGQATVVRGQQFVPGAVTPAASSHRRLDSMGGSESDGSAYTDSSLGKPSPGVGASSVNSTPPSYVHTTDTRITTDLLTSSLGAPGNRPSPLNLSSSTNTTIPSKESPGLLLYGQEKHQSHTSSNRSPLLHTSWGSPLSSPAPNHTSNQFPPTPDQVPNSSAAAYFPPEARFGVLGRKFSGSDALSADGSEPMRQTSPPSLSPNNAVDRIEDGPVTIRSARVVIEDFTQEVSPPTTQAALPDSPALIGHGSPSPSVPSETNLGSSTSTVGAATTTNSTSRLPTGDKARGISGDRLDSSGEDIKPLNSNVVTAETKVSATGSINTAASSPTMTTARPLLAPSSLTTPSPRPSLSELRGLQPGQDQTNRQSLFLPHPNAPKAPSAHSPGPMYITQKQPPPPQPNVQQMRGGILQTIRIVLSNQGFPTIYGITTEDLSASTGPVLMHFSVTPPPAKAPPPGLPSEAALQNGYLPNASPVPVHAIRKIGSTASLDTAISTVTEDSGVGSGLIPRANFFPKVGSVRPRSRSFSGFQSTTAEIPLPIQRSHEEGPRSPEMPSANEIKRALSPIVASPVTPSPSHSPAGKNMPPKPSPLRVSSPLQHSHNGDTNGRPLKPPNSPLGQRFPTRHDPLSPTSTSSPGQPSLKLAVNDLGPPSSTQRSLHPTNAAPQPTSRPSVDTDAMSVHGMRSHVTSPQASTGRHGHESLRSKLSLPNLRKNTTRHDDMSAQAPESPAADGAMLQVQDMDFELVRPTITHFQAARTSEDSNVLGNNRDGSIDSRHDTDHLRTESPMSPIPPYSPITTSEAHTSVPGPWQPSKPANSLIRTAESESSMDAHRQRELKWMSILASVPPSQSRKSKKVKKLLLEGVPSSVRYLVWSHLTDGKGRCVPGVYTQLVSRDKAPMLVDVERDIQKCFADHPQLQSISGSILSLMQAYLTMVPDIQYTSGLTSIAGQLLFLAPEEDAFWIFVSIMDSHMRPYFRLATTQIDIDASLFSRSLEAIDSAIAKKLFTELSIPPVVICRPWFTTLFTASLPSSYLNRVWDIFLFEGIPFLFRVGLVLISCYRRQILESTSQDSITKALLNPSLSILPPSPESFVNLALDMKLKDDDVRKQRVKLEAQAKRHTQAPRTVSSPNAISLPRPG